MRPLSADPERFARAIAAIDAINAQDPHEVVVDGKPRPKELVHAEAMTAWLAVLDPDADEHQQLAARAHHLRRWSIPRSSYPAGRSGYLRWRTTLRKQHAAETAALLAAEGYDTAAADRVAAIIDKQGLHADPQVQTHQDALCLTFVELQLRDVATSLGEDKTVEVIAKTARKMSPRALELAATIEVGDHARSLLHRALAGPTIEPTDMPGAP